MPFMSCDVHMIHCLHTSVQGHHGRTRAMSRLPVSPSGHAAYHSSSHHGSHTHLNGHAHKTEQDSSKRRSQPIVSDSKTKGIADLSRVNGQVKRTSLVMESGSTKPALLGRQVSKEESSRTSTTSSNDPTSLVGSSQKQSSKLRF